MHHSGCVTVCVAQVKSCLGKKDRSLSRHVKCEHEQIATRCKICKANNSGGDSLCLHGRQQGWCLACRDKFGKVYYGDNRRNRRKNG